MSDFKERVNEIMDDFKGRVKNPLILSFILIWLYKHWSIVYKVLTFDNTIDVNERISQINCYIKCKGWCEMVFMPILFAVISLIVFYLIAAAAQFIKLYLGVRLQAYLFAKHDTGKYVLRIKLDSEKRAVNSLKNQNEEMNKELISLRNYKKNDEETALEAKLNIEKLNKEIQELKHNKEVNSLIKERLEHASSYLLFLNLKEKYKLPDSLSMPLDVKSDDFKITNGNWKVEYSTSYIETLSTYETRIFKDSIVTKTNTKHVGEMKNYQYDKRNHILTYDLLVSTVNTIPHMLIRVTNDEFIGFTNNSFVRMIRND